MEIPNIICEMEIKNFLMKKFTNPEIIAKKNLPVVIKNFFQHLYFNKKNHYISSFAHSLQIEIIEDCNDETWHNNFFFNISFD